MCAFSVPGHGRAQVWVWRWNWLRCIIKGSRGQKGSQVMGAVSQTMCYGKSQLERWLLTGTVLSETLKERWDWGYEAIVKKGEQKMYCFFCCFFFCLFLRCLLFHVKISGSITNQGLKKKVRQFGGKYFGVGCYQRGLALPKAASVGGHETIIPASLAPPSVPVPNKQDVLHFPRSWCSCGEERRAAWDSSGLGYFLRPESPVLGSKLPGSSIIRIFFLKLSTCVCRVTSVMSDSLLPYGP